VRDEKTGEVARKVNFEVLRQLLGDNATDGDGEMYQFTWVGKNAARGEAAAPTTKTLRPVVEDSVDWDTTKNIYIEGDNLEVLKLLQCSYMGKVKMIYIDPPYNTGNDFVYHDDFARTATEEDLEAGNIDELGNRFRKNTDTNGKFHSDWCSMIYPRLMVARSLLTEDGVIFISIDDGELNNMKRICDEIFGSANFRNTILVRRRIKSLNSQFADNGLSTMNVAFEYILVYAKSEQFLMQALRQKKADASTKGRWDVFWSNADRPTMRYDILGFTLALDNGEMVRKKQK
jgi:adenine-specific DNA-methyltransferase